MKTKNIKILLTGIILLAITFLSKAQESSTMYFMKGMPQANMYNPAMHNDSSKVVIGLPGISGIYFGLDGDFALNELIHYGTGNMSDSLIIDLDGFHNSLKEQNSFNQKLDISLFHLGIRSNNMFFNFAVKEKQSSHFGFGKGFVTFLKDGNAPYIGQEFDLGNLDLDFYHYREYSVGASRALMNGRLSVGAKIKLLYGKMALQTEKLNFKVNTAENGTSIDLKTDMKINLSSPFVLEYDEDNFLNGFEEGFEASEYIMAKDNMGMAFDLGMVFKITPKITVSASIIDIGKLTFDTNTKSISINKNYIWEGLDFSNSLDDTDANYISVDDMVNEELDKLEAVIRPKKENVSTGSFDMSLPTKIFIGGSYDISDIFSVGLLDRIYLYDGELENSITVSANAMLGRFLSLTGSYSAINGTYDNLGLGIGLKAGPLQFYMVNDNLIALSNPAEAQFVNIRFGMNLLFGKK